MEFRLLNKWSRTTMFNIELFTSEVSVCSYVIFHRLLVEAAMLRTSEFLQKKGVQRAAGVCN
jgi:hypothetical protein